MTDDEWDNLTAKSKENLATRLFPYTWIFSLCIGLANLPYALGYINSPYPIWFDQGICSANIALGLVIASYQFYSLFLK